MSFTKSAATKRSQALALMSHEERVAAKAATKAVKVQHSTDIMVSSQLLVLTSLEKDFS